MRIAVSGTHFSGKSTLIQALVKEYPEYEVFDEPYWILTELGHNFSDPPTIEEFEEQLECSIDLLKNSSHNALFDRCPMDFLAYALAVAEENSIDIDSETWEERIANAMPSLDLVAFLPIEKPDRILIPSSEDKHFRKRVDEKLRELIMENALDIMDTKVVEVKGSISERFAKIKKYCSP
ncbi:MAG TPA: AAA family ATPase [Rhabdochlamydiaceae bacterium]|jgi:hypothetical protein